MDTTLAPFLASENFDRTMEHLATLRRPVDAFSTK